jgi:photosystem II stability/assembly factor-like uncharacterized protein
MKNIPFTIVLLVFIFASTAEGQNQFMPHDELPGLIKSYKPLYDPAFPDWAKELYRKDISFYEINQAFEDYIIQNPRKKNAIIKYYKNWRRAVAEYILPDGSISLPDMDDFYANLMDSQLNDLTVQERNANNSHWTFLGPKETFWLNHSGVASPPDPAPWQVNIYSLDVAPSDYNILYTGTETGFVNKTVDKGLNWELIAPDYLFGGAITAVAIHPTDPDIVYVAGGYQIHRSLDGGANWTPLLPLNGLFAADRLIINHSNPSKMFAAAHTGIYVSFDAGATWQNKWQHRTWDIRIKPGDYNRIFAVSQQENRFVMAQSADGGQSFSKIINFPSDHVASDGAYLAVTPANPDILMTVLLSSNHTPYLLKGIANGDEWTWELIATGRTSAFEMDNGQGYFDLVLAISPLDEDIILAGTTTLFKSENGGKNFTAVGGYWGPFNIHPDIQDIKMLDNGETWVSTDGGMNLTTDNFTSLSNYHVRCRGLMGSDFWGFDQGWNEDLVVGGRYHNGNTAVAEFYLDKALRMGGAESPTGWVLQGKSRHVAFDDLGNGWILPRTTEEAPEGRFIFSKFPNMDEYGGRRSNFVHHPNYYGTFFLGEGNGFWKSTDLGVTYELLYNFPGRVRYLQISYKNPDVFYVDVVNHGLYRSEDGGHSWTQKPSITDPPYGNSYWRGRLFFAISPYDENVIYACLQNGTWSADIGKVFRSTDGGDSWKDWSGSLNDYLKSIVIQPTQSGDDLVYLFTRGQNGIPAKVYIRKPAMDDWEDFSNDYPVGMHPNMALPFFRDSKIRVAGNGSVWESQLAEPSFTPILNPWIEKAFYNCMTDTLYFDDHSILNHEGAEWHWQITPAPQFINDPNIRNPKVVLGNPGTYSVKFTVKQNGISYAKTIENMVTTTTCPSIEDCNNPAELPKSEWELIYTDSEETAGENGRAINAFDNDPSTIWHTQWYWATDPYPHEMQIDLGDEYRLSSFTYLNRQDSENGRIKNYELYISNDKEEWGSAIKNGEFVNTGAPQSVVFEEPVVGRYMRLRALSEINGNPWASAAELGYIGCLNRYSNTEDKHTYAELKAFPVPSDGIFFISMPPQSPHEYSVYNAQGSLIRKAYTDGRTDQVKIDLSGEKPGLYIIKFRSAQSLFTAKVIKN